MEKKRHSIGIKIREPKKAEAGSSLAVFGVMGVLFLLMQIIMLVFELFDISIFIR